MSHISIHLSQLRVVNEFHVQWFLQLSKLRLMVLLAFHNLLWCYLEYIQKWSSDPRWLLWFMEILEKKSLHMARFHMSFHITPPSSKLTGIAQGTTVASNSPESPQIAEKKLFLFTLKFRILASGLDFSMPSGRGFGSTHCPRTSLCLVDTCCRGR